MFFIHILTILLMCILGMQCVHHTPVKIMYNINVKKILKMYIFSMFIPFFFWLLSSSRVMLGIGLRHFQITRSCYQ
ncbi:Uncharacterised protein [Enterobacter ludwigii]|nr:Uncharacterised protein [Enterobacter ludwigii]